MPEQKPPMAVAAFVLVHPAGGDADSYQVLTGSEAHATPGEFDMWLEFGSKEDAMVELQHYTSQKAGQETLQGPQAPHSRQRQLRARMPKAQRRRG